MYIPSLLNAHSNNFLRQCPDQISRIETKTIIDLQCSLVQDKTLTETADSPSIGLQWHHGAMVVGDTIVLLDFGRLFPVAPLSRYF